RNDVKAMLLAAGAAALLTAGCGTRTDNGAAPDQAAAAQKITGAGFTFVYPVLAAWSADYAKQTGAAVNYQSIGSGGRGAAVKAGAGAFGENDPPREPA